MYYEVYIDAVFLTNLIMDFVMLRLIKYLFKCECTWLHTLAGAVIGAAGACLILCIPTDSSYAGILLLHGILAVIMVKVGCRIQKNSLLLRAVVALYFTAFLCGGFWDVMSAEGGMTLKTFLLSATLTYVFFRCVLLFRDCFKIRMENLYQVRLNYQGKVLCIKGLYDTGNRLYDKGSKKPVSVVSGKVLRELLPETMCELLLTYQISAEETNGENWGELMPHFLTFQSVGNPSGVVLAITLDEMCILGEQRTFWIHRPVLAISKEEFLDSKDYQIILNAELIQN